MRIYTPAEIVSLLSRQYGPINWKTRRDPVSQLVMTILSQNTSDSNSGRAFERLKRRFPKWEDAARAPVQDIYEAIEQGGLARVKAPRIKKILQGILAERGSLNIDFLKDVPVEQARVWLDNLPGFGPKSTAVVLLFAFGKPVLPVDTHVFRVAKRLGLIDAKISVEQAHEVLGAMVGPDLVYRFHVYMVEHGRRTCKAGTPLCSRCILLERCPTGIALTGSPARA